MDPSIIFSFEAHRKSKEDKKLYTIHIDHNENLIFTKVDKPKTFRFDTTLSNVIHFHFELVHDKKKPVRIDIKLNNKNKQFFAKPEDLLELRNKLRDKAIFSKIQDFYVPLQTIGSGSSSRVLLVRDKTTEKYFAAKCIDKKYIDESEEGLEAMYLEINIMRKLKHPQFITLYEVFEGETTFYMVMDLMEGKSLHDEICKNANGYPEEDVKTMMRLIAKGVEFMHEQKIMHRDLKPENIMFQKKEDHTSLKIVDFGLSTFTECDHYLFPKCGTPGYVAPEVANLEDKTKKYDSICDVFSLGCIMFKLLTGKDLFPGTQFNTILKLNKKCEIDLSAAKLRKVSQQSIELMELMLEKDPTKRLASKQILNHAWFGAQQQLTAAQQAAALKKQGFQKMKQDPNAKPVWQTYEFKNVPEQQNHLALQAGSKQNVIIRDDVGSLVVKDNGYGNKPKGEQNKKFTVNEMFDKKEATQQKFQKYYQNQGDQEIIEEEN